MVDAQVIPEHDAVIVARGLHRDELFLHVCAHRGQGIADDFERDGVQRGGHPAMALKFLPRVTGPYWFLLRPAPPVSEGGAPEPLRRVCILITPLPPRS